MNRSLTLSFFLQKPKRFRLLSICANAVYNDVIQSLKDNSSIKIYTELKNDEIHKEHISLSLSLYLSMHFDFPERMCMYRAR